MILGNGLCRGEKEEEEESESILESEINVAKHLLEVGPLCAGSVYKRAAYCFTASGAILKTETVNSGSAYSHNYELSHCLRCLPAYPRCTRYCENRIFFPSLFLFSPSSCLWIFWLLINR